MQGFPAPSLPKKHCTITLTVGKRTFVGIGQTIVLAKLNAASRALEVLKSFDAIERETASQTGNIENLEADLQSPVNLVHDTAMKRGLRDSYQLKLNRVRHVKKFIALCKVCDIVTEGEGKDRETSKNEAAKKMLEELNKMPRSQLILYALTRDLTASFEVKRKLVSSHIDKFITSCIVGDIVTEGKGNSKKISKRRAAEEMLHELEKLPPLLSENIMEIKILKIKTESLKKKLRNFMKEKLESEITEDINPISKLIEIQQALKEQVPVYTVVEEKDELGQQFVIEASVSGQVARGVGSSKKIAKRMAAKNLLISMGYDNVSVNKENNSHIENRQESPGKLRKETVFNENRNNAEGANQASSSGRQIAPVLSLSQQNENVPKSEKSNMSSTCHDIIRPKDQLLYLAQVLGIQVVFSDYPKRNHAECLAIVTLSTDPPQMCHGSGSDVEAAQDKASIAALQTLSTSIQSKA